MKKETREKISEFKNKEAKLLMAILENPTNSAVCKLLLAKLKRDKAQWLSKVGGWTMSLPPETLMKLEELVAKASEAISTAAVRNFQLQAYLKDAYKNGSASGRQHELMIENYGQLEALSEMAAEQHVRSLERFNNKINGRSFLSILMCKFRKAKAQEKESDKTSVSSEKE